MVNKISRNYLIFDLIIGIHVVIIIIIILLFTSNSQAHVTIYHDIKNNKII